MGSSLKLYDEEKRRMKIQQANALRYAVESLDYAAIELGHIGAAGVIVDLCEAFPFLAEEYSDMLEDAREAMDKNDVEGFTT